MFSDNNTAEPSAVDVHTYTIRYSYVYYVIHVRMDLHVTRFLGLPLAVRALTLQLHGTCALQLHWTPNRLDRVVSFCHTPYNSLGIAGDASDTN